jgi:hypothetical protein
MMKRPRPPYYWDHELALEWGLPYTQLIRLIKDRQIKAKLRSYGEDWRPEWNTDGYASWHWMLNGTPPSG